MDDVFLFDGTYARSDLLIADSLLRLAMHLMEADLFLAFESGEQSHGYGNEGEPEIAFPECPDTFGHDRGSDGSGFALGETLAPSAGKLFELLLRHRFHHLARGSSELRALLLVALGSKGGSGGLLLRFRSSWHDFISHLLLRCFNVQRSIPVPDGNGTRHAAAALAQA